RPVVGGKRVISAARSSSSEHFRHALPTTARSTSRHCVGMAVLAGLVACTRWAGLAEWTGVSLARSADGFKVLLANLFAAGSLPIFDQLVVLGHLPTAHDDVDESTVERLHQREALAEVCRGNLAECWVGHCRWH